MGLASKKSLLLAVLFGFSFAFIRPSLAHADKSQDILEQARRKLQSKSDQAHIVLQIIKTSGETKTLEMNIQTLISSGGFRAIVRMTAPADDKGTALLTVVHGANTKQWL